MDKDWPYDPTGLNPLDARVGMALAYWAYPHQDVEEAKKLISYPEPWERAEAGVHLPAEWLLAEFDGQGRLLREGWNTRHDAGGKLVNQFGISINPETRQITFDFKGSDHWKNWVSDLANAGASEFAQIRDRAQAAYEALKNDARYKDYHFAATGHSLGGGMAQSFALRNGIDVYAYNSLPIARDTIKGDYFQEAGGYESALARYRAQGHKVVDVRTPNDVATHVYEGVMQNAYLSRQTGQPPMMLPGAAIPDFLKTALLLSKAGTLPVLAVMGKDHTMQALVDAQQGLKTGEDGRYRLPEGQRDFAGIPAQARKRFALLSLSPVTRAAQIVSATEGYPWNRYELERADGGRQYLSSNPRSGEVEIEHYGADGRRVRVELNGRSGKPATFIELDAQGREIGRSYAALSAPVLDEVQQGRLAQAERELGPRLRGAGWSQAQVGHVCAAAVNHCASKMAELGEPERFMLSGDGQRVGVLHRGGMVLSEMPVEAALERSREEHLTEAVRLQQQAHQQPRMAMERGGMAPSVCA